MIGLDAIGGLEALQFPHGVEGHDGMKIIKVGSKGDGCTGDCDDCDGDCDDCEGDCDDCREGEADPRNAAGAPSSGFFFGDSGAARRTPRAQRAPMPRTPMMMRARAAQRQKADAHGAELEALREELGALRQEIRELRNMLRRTNSGR